MLVYYNIWGWLCFAIFLWIKVWVYCVNLNKILDYFFQSVPCPRVIGLFSTHFTNLFLWRMGTQDNQDDQENLVTITNPIQEKKKIRDHIKICLAKKKIDYFQTSKFFFQLYEINPPTPHFCSHRLCLIFSSKLQHWQSVNCKNLPNNSTQLIMKHWNNSCRCIRGS